MPSSYTGSGIELIADGEQSGTWGQTTNDNLQIISRMTSEAGSIALSGTTHTLTISDGVLSDGQYGVLVFTGSPSGTNTVTVSPSTAKRVFMVRNTTAQSVVMSQGSGANVTILAGTARIVYTDGAGAGAAVFDITNTLAANTAATLQTARTINGVSFNGSANITVTANTTNTLTRGTYLTGANFNGSAATTWAVDATTTNTASKVVARDGSGNFAAGTITAALTGNASTATTLQTARTINGTSFNGSANITTANWGTARTIWGQSINGSADITAPILPAAGSAAAPAFSTSGDTNTGIFFPAADTIAITEGGVEVIRVNSSANVGIGTTTPAAKLDVGGTGAIKVPVGTEAQRPTAATGQLRFNSDVSKFEGYDGTAWGTVGGGGGFFKGENGSVGDATTGPGDIFRINEQTLNTSTTIDSDENASCTGPLTVASGVTLTVNGNLAVI